MSNQNDRPEIPETEYEKPINKGGDLPPLPLLPDREWLAAKIANVEYRYAMFNGKIQYITKQELDPETNEEVEIAILDDDGNKIPRKEFNIKFALRDYNLPNDKGPRCCWLTLGASLGERAHLPTLIFNVIGQDFQPESPRDLIDNLTGKEVRIQLKNKPNKKDPTKPPYQNVIYDAVEKPTNRVDSQPPGPIGETEVNPQTGEDIAWDE